MAAGKTKALQDRIDRVFALADGCDDYEMKAELACFIAVLTSGLIELSCRHFLYSYSSNRARPEVVAYVESNLYFFQNAKAKRIQKLFGSFHRAFADRITSDLTEEEVAAIDSVVNNKNNLAHGANSGLGLETMRSYYCCVLSALKKLQATLR